MRRARPLRVLLFLAGFSLWVGGLRAQETEEIRSFDADLGPAYIDISTYPAEFQALYPLFAQKCSKCHTLARPINSSMTGDEWWGYVTRMSGKPGSGISPKTAKEIFRFLAHDSTVRARSTNAVDPALAPFLEVSKELSGVPRIVAGTKNVPADGPTLHLRLEGDRRLSLKSLFANEEGQKLTRWTQREPSQGELQVRRLEVFEGEAPEAEDPLSSGPVAAAAMEAVGNETDPEERIDLLLDWLDESIERAHRSGDVEAETVLQERRGDATEFTRLFCGMARSLGVPVRTRVGLVAQRTAFHFHPWAEVWLEGWVPVDPYLGQFPADVTHIRLVGEERDGLSAWDAGRYPGLERLRVSVILEEDESTSTGGGE